MFDRWENLLLIGFGNKGKNKFIDILELIGAERINQE